MRIHSIPPILVATVIALSASACGETPTSPSDAETAGPPYTIAFESTLAPGGSSSRTFSVGGPGTVDVTLASTTPPDLWLSIGIGIPTTTRTGCSLTAAITVAPGSSSHLQLAADAGSYCVQVSDPGRLAAVVGFSVTIVHP